MGGLTKYPPPPPGANEEYHVLIVTDGTMHDCNVWPLARRPRLELVHVA